MSSVQRETKLLKLHLRIVNIHTFLSRHVTNRNNHNNYTYSTNVKQSSQSVNANVSALQMYVDARDRLLGK